MNQPVGKFQMTDEQGLRKDSKDRELEKIEKTVSDEHLVGISRESVLGFLRSHGR